MMIASVYFASLLRMLVFGVLSVMAYECVLQTCSSDRQNRDLRISFFCLCVCVCV